MPLARVLRYEWLQLMRVRLLPPLLAAFVLCSVVAVMNGRAHVMHRDVQARELAADEAARYLKLRHDLDDYASGRKRAVGFIDPASAGLIGRTSGARVAVQPARSLSTMALGQLDLYPGYYRVTTDYLDEMLAQEELDNPEHLAVGRFDLAFVFVFLYPLLILAMSHDLIAADRDAGRLSLVLASAHRPRMIFTARVLLRAGVLLAVVVSLSLIGGLFDHGSFSIARMALWCLALALYTLFWVALALLVNTARLTASASAVTLATAWVALVLVIPQTMHLAVTYIYPTASRVQLLEAVRVATQEAVQQGSSLLLRFLDDHPALAPDLDPSDYLTRSTAVQAEVDRIMSPVLARYQHQLETQQQTVDRYQWLSPAILLQGTLEELAGTGPASIKDFQAQVKEFHQRWAEFFLPKTVARVRFTPADLATIPGFTYEARFPDAVWTPLALLLLLASVVGTVAIWRLRRL